MRARRLRCRVSPPLWTGEICFLLLLLPPTYTILYLQTHGACLFPFPSLFLQQLHERSFPPLRQKCRGGGKNGHEGKRWTAGVEFAQRKVECKTAACTLAACDHPLYRVKGSKIGAARLLANSKSSATTPIYPSLVHRRRKKGRGARFSSYLFFSNWGSLFANNSSSSSEKGRRPQKRDQCGIELCGWVGSSEGNIQETERQTDLVSPFSPPHPAP